MGAGWNRLNEAVLTCTRGLCFRQEYKNCYKKSTENCHFCSPEKLLYVAWACFRNEFILYVLKFHFLLSE